MLILLSQTITTSPNIVHLCIRFSIVNLSPYLYDNTNPGQTPAWEPWILPWAASDQSSLYPHSSVVSWSRWIPWISSFGRALRGLSNSSPSSHSIHTFPVWLQARESCHQIEKFFTGELCTCLSNYWIVTCGDPRLQLLVRK